MTAQRLHRWLIFLTIVLIPLSARAETLVSGPIEKTVVYEISFESENDSKGGDENEPEAAEPGPETETEPESEEFAEEEVFADPLEPWNRLVFTFNDKLYFWVMKPLSKGYNAVVPEVVRVSLSNLFHNLKMPIRFVNDVLQGKMKSAVIELARFTINTTIGLAGLFDVAKEEFDLKSPDKDLGLTLGYYGIGNGLYIIWPFLGPSSIRDTIGMVGDGFLDPVNYVTPLRDVLAIQSYDYFNSTSLHVGEYEDLKESAIEPYIAVRDAYFQHRRSEINR